MFKIYFLLSVAGQVFMLLLSISKFYRETKQLNFLETVKKYFNPSVVMTMAAQFILQTVFAFLLTIEGGGWIITFFTGGQIPDATPVGFYLFAFFCGAFTNIIAIIIGKMMKADQLIGYEHNPLNPPPATTSDEAEKTNNETQYLRRNAAQENADRNNNANRLNPEVEMIDSLMYVGHDGCIFTDPEDGILYNIKKVSTLPEGKKYFAVDPYTDTKGNMGDYIGVNHVGLCKIIPASRVEGN